MNYVFVWLSLIYGLVFLHIQITTQTYIMEYPLLLLVSATLKKKKKKKTSQHVSAKKSAFIEITFIYFLSSRPA